MLETETEVITISKVEVKLGDNVILKDIDLNIRKGEIVGFLGPSGSGKTTLVKAIIGMNKASGGNIEVLGVRMPSLEIATKIGYMAQSDALYEDLNAMGNLIFFAELYGVKRKEAKIRAEEVLALVGLSEYAKKAVRYFSGGMKRRLSLAIALMHKPQILILDEPTVGIDPVLRKSFWNEFEKIRAAGGTIIVTTHVMDEAYKCDRLALIREGEIIAEGSPEEIIKATGARNIEEAFLCYSGVKEEAEA
ncbi:ABC transporter ATP-binding protein [Clostridium cellulovorans]|uniref:ABC transporter related n=1 Tax=Clostridium cellulovorans (strain ATCC 35296 / DSM 3052 / OCM 3 / 743B) TaxID=573061 RepID=D9SPN5_CLOC7|nr:ABC transporter ATP-binding protein [Clostridium cellulovorans]ADL50084.1 ABC transporter related [Clostridium cellulovorans 743B]